MSLEIAKIFRFVTLPLKIPDRMKLYRWKFHKIVLHSLDFPRPKPTPMESPHYFFLITPRNSSSFFTDTPGSRSFHILFFLIPLEIPCPSPPLFFFFNGRAHYNFVWKLLFHTPRKEDLNYVFAFKTHNVESFFL